MREIRPTAVLATCCLSLFLVSMDVTIVNVALPAIAKDLDASVAGLQWSIDAYTVVIASFLMLAGSTADRLGRRRVFQFGLALFSTGSLLCSLAPTLPALVAFRVVQALGGAMLNPVAMSIIVNTITDPKQRARAIGIWGAVFGLSMAIGPVLGGFLSQSVGWRSIFWINVPVGIIAIVLTTRVVPESRAAVTRRLDPVAQLLIVIGLGALTMALIEGSRSGWGSPLIVGGFALAAASVIAFIAYERRRREPLVDLRFFRSVPFSSATALAVVAFTTFTGFLFLNSLYLQDTRGLRASDAGLCMLPIALALVICSPLSGRLVGAGHARRALVISGCATMLGAGLLTDLRIDTPLWQLLVAYAILGVGIGMVNAPITNAAVTGMPRAQAGFAAALASTSRQVGATFGVALGGMIIGGTSAYSPAFATAFRPFCWLAVACGATVVCLGIAATTARARESVQRVAALLDAPDLLD